MLRKVYAAVLITVTITALLAVLFGLGLFETWQDTLSDKLFAPKPSHPEIVIIAIDDESISEIGRFPWTRTVYVDLLDKVGPQAAAVGLDISFLEPESKEVDNALASALKRSGNVTIAAEISEDRVLTPIKPLSQEAKVGTINLRPSVDGVNRHAILKTTAAEGKYQNFAISVAETYLNFKNLSPDYLQGVPLEGNSFLRINFSGPPGTYKQYPFADVLNGRVDLSNFKDKIVLIGATAPNLHDDRLVPTSSGFLMSGVEIHAHTISTLLAQKYLVPESTLGTIATTTVVVVISTVILVFVGVAPGLVASIAMLIGYILYTILAFDSGVIKNIVFPSFALVLSIVSSLVYKYLTEFRQKRFLRKAFSFYLSEEILKEIIANPKKLALGGERKEISVLFSDIAGFTSISEKLEPETLAQMLNNYLTEMTTIVFEHNGVLDKYIGDAVMAFWGAPLADSEHALNACKTAVIMQKRVKEIEKSWRDEMGIDLGIRIGINTGDMVVGNMGSHMRFDYTLIGDGVNLGARLEGINKEYGTEITISQGTYEKVKDEVVARKIDTVAVKGKSKGVVIYELRGIGAPSGPDRKFLERFEKARIEYEKGNFKKALERFQDFLKKHPDDTPSKVYVERLKILTRERPKDWDGIFKATSK